MSLNHKFIKNICEIIKLFSEKRSKYSPPVTIKLEKG